MKNKRKTPKRKHARVTTGLFDSKKEYQELLSTCREKYPDQTDLNIFLFARECIMHQETEIKLNRKECQAIVGGLKITDFKKIPYILKDDFQDRICGISKKPIYKVVAIRESADSDPIYYEWSNLVRAVENEKVPENWPKTVLFGPEEVVVDHLATKNIQNRLKKAALKSNITRRARAVLKQLDKQKGFLEAMKELSLADIVGCKIDKECISSIDDRLLSNAKLDIEKLRGEECLQ
ncbi:MULTISPECIES: hypothetical protein [Candidatus Rhabdochlamydia]|nr:MULTISPECIES: hypothetical protein [Rhabdochlamydia]